MTSDKKQFWVILIIVFLGFVGISMPYLIFPALFMNPEYSILPLQSSETTRVIYLGITLAAYPLGQFIGSPILGALSDDYGRKPLLAWSLFISAFCTLISGAAIGWKFLGLLIFSRFLAGLMEGNIAIARALASDLKSISKHQTFGKINAMASMAYLLGPFLGGILSDKTLLEQFTPATPFYFTGILFFFLGILSIVVLKKSVPTEKKELYTIWERLNLFKRLAAIFENKQLKFLIITSTILTLAVDIFYEFGPVYLTMKWALSPSQLTLYNGILCITLVIGNGYLPTFISNRTSNRKAILYSTALLAACLIGIAFTDSPTMMLILFAISGIAIGISCTLITIKISDKAAPEIQGEVMGTQISMRVLGDALICLLGGALLLLSPNIILILAAFMCLITLLYYRTGRKIV